MAKTDETKNNQPNIPPTEVKKPEVKICGIIMPISPTDGYTDLHWQEVMAIIRQVVNDAGFEPNIVSDADDVGIIHNRIVNNLAENPIVICDVSSKNPNVMFELGMRLAFDKATIIIKDDITSYNFDTSPIEHVGYPADLHYHKIEEFKQKLKSKLISTYEASLQADYSTFLKHFVRYKPLITTEEVPATVFFEKQFEKVFNLLEQLDFGESKSATRSFLKTRVLNSNGLKINSVNELKSYLFQKYSEMYSTGNVTFDSPSESVKELINYIDADANSPTDKFSAPVVLDAMFQVVYEFERSKESHNKNIVSKLGGLKPIKP
jgi:hypothetical protein